MIGGRRIAAAACVALCVVCIGIVDAFAMPTRLLAMRGTGGKVCSRTWAKGWDATPRARAGRRGVRMGMDAWSSSSDRLAAQGMDVWVSDGMHVV